jgi:hypothetical protein
MCRKLQFRRVRTTRLGAAVKGLTEVVSVRSCRVRQPASYQRGSGRDSRT